MERDCFISHGANAFLKERLMDNSDKYTTHICNKCGLFAIYDKVKDYAYCKNCEGEDNECVKINMPYACKLLFQELMSMNITPRISIK